MKEKTLTPDKLRWNSVDKLGRPVGTGVYVCNSPLEGRQKRFRVPVNMFLQINDEIA